MKLTVDQQQSLVEAHLPIAKTLARRYRGQGVDSNDLYQEAALGLAEAARRFDPELTPIEHFGEYARSQSLKRVIAAIDAELQNRTQAELPEIPAPEPDLHQERISCEVEAALESLDPFDRELLRDREGIGRRPQSILEMTNRLGVSAATLKRRLDEIRKQFKLEMTKRGWRDRSESASQQQLNLA
jgi:RNA polymerase sigma factor (sigma-70 family)